MTNETRLLKRTRATADEMEARHDRLVELAGEHHPCSVRNLYYRAVVDGLVPKTRNGYMKVQRAVLDLRRDGRIPYSWIVDNSRSRLVMCTYGDVDEFLHDVAGVYRRDLWRTSPWRVEVWCESDSISGIIRDTVKLWRVPLMAMRGQTSETFAHEAVEVWSYDPDRRPVVLYVGDHDPAGLEIEDALVDKLTGFAADAGVVPPKVIRVGVTWDQAVDLDLPGGKPKKPYGFPRSVEAEALPPGVLRDLVDDAIADYADHDAIATLKAVERQERQGLLSLVDQFNGVA